MRGVLAACAIALIVCASAAQAGGRSLQHVTLIGDSVADAIPGNAPAVAMLRQGIDLDLEVEPCRRVDGEGCPGTNGVRPPSVVQLVKSLGSKLGDNVVVSVGYNDFEDQYATNIETALDAFKAAGVKHVWWLTLRAAHHPYVNMNDDIEAAAKQHPEMTVVDWNVYSRSHPDWFQDDGLHLLAEGSLQMATLIHQALLDDKIAAKPVRVSTSTLPPAHERRVYRVKLAATSGTAPYRWSLLARAPKGFHLEADGRIVGKPLVGPGAYALNVRVKDAAGSFDTRKLVLRVKP
jgi:hypothetical protein